MPRRLPTRSGYRITPVVLWAAGRRCAGPNPAEVEAAYRIPLPSCCGRRATVRQHPEVEGPILQMPICDRLIHAPTAAVLYQFREVALRGNRCGSRTSSSRPFAWR